MKHATHLSKRIFSLLLALLLTLTLLPTLALTANAATPSMVYYKNTNNWDTVCAYFFAGNETVDTAWPGKTMTFDGSYWSISVPSGANSVIFNNGSGNGYQTADLTLPTDGKAYYDDGWSVDGSSTYTVAGSTGLCGSDWNTEDTTNDMTLNADGLYEKVFTNVAAGDYTFKIAKNHSWIKSWGKDGGSDNCSVTVAADGSTVTITFNPNTEAITATSKEPVKSYTITVSESANGTVEADKETAAAGDTVTLTVKPAAGYELDKLTVTYENADGETQNVEVAEDHSFTMPASNVTVTAAFKETVKRYTITVNGSENGTVEADKQSTSAGDTVTLTVTPATGYKLDSLTISYTDAEGAPQSFSASEGVDGAYTFVMPASNVTVTAAFSAINAEITGVTLEECEGYLGALEIDEANQKYIITIPAGEDSIAVTMVVTGTGLDKISEADKEDGTYQISGGAVLEASNYDEESGNAVFGTRISLNDGGDLRYTNDGGDTWSDTGWDVVVKQNYFITNNTNAAVTAPAEAAAGDTVTLTVTPDAVDELDTIVVTYKDADGETQNVTVTDNTFVMPAFDVTVAIKTDAVAPVITGVNNEGTYYTTQTATVTDANLTSVTVNGKAVTVTDNAATVTLAGNTDLVYTIIATDSADNKTTYTVTMKSLTTLLNAIVEDTKDVTDENVPLSQEDDLIETQAALEAFLETYKNDLTEAQKTAAQQHLARIEDALTAIDNANAVIDAIDALKTTDSPDDKDALAAGEAYDALTDHEKELVGNTKAAKLEKILTNYKITKGNGGKWTKSSGKTLSFTVNGALSKFVGVKVDGKTIDTKNYTLANGTTVVKLTSKYLETLSTGKHTITFTYTDGEVSGTFRVVKASSTPATGDEFPIGTVAIVMLLSLAVLVCLLPRKFKKA